MTCQRYKRHEFVIRQGKGNHNFYIIKKGKVKISSPQEQGQDIIFAFLQDGDFFGEMSILDHDSCSADAECMQKCDIFSIRTDKFRKMLREIPGLSFRLLSSMSQRLRFTNHCIENLNCRSSLRRVSMVINQIAMMCGYRSKKSVIIEKIPFQQEIASLAGTTRETVSRKLSYLEKQGYIKKSGHRLVIPDYTRFYEDLCL
ncbi:MAG: Crp/Fnr family transcriptional regulator [Candidatus Neomarinimicrobiota bacterium]|nr:Crp/Fnr family transcriptional regulator [Candidatus Neomarinimicrobiota bacterium]